MAAASRLTPMRWSGVVYRNRTPTPPAPQRTTRQERCTANRDSGGSPEFAGLREKSAATLLLALGGADCLLTVAEMARRLRVCKATVYKLVEQGRLAHVRMGNSIRFVVDPRPCR